MRIHGRAGIIYVGQTATTDASPCAYMTDWDITFAAARTALECVGDPNLIYVPGLPEASGDFTGWYDTETTQTYIAAVDSLPRNFYLYPSVTQDDRYFFGRILPDFNVTSSTSGAVSVKATWAAASPVFRSTTPVPVPADTAAAADLIETAGPHTITLTEAAAAAETLATTGPRDISTADPAAAAEAFAQFSVGDIDDQGGSHISDQAGNDIQAG